MAPDMCEKSVLPGSIVKQSVSRAAGLLVFFLVRSADLCRPGSRLSDNLGSQALSLVKAYPAEMWQGEKVAGS